MAEFVTLYGPYVALILVFLSWAAKNVWPVLVKHEEQEREERAQLIELVKNNTQAMTHVATAVEVLSRDVGHLYTHLNLARPERPVEEK
jgi:hypothetical protein